MQSKINITGQIGRAPDEPASAGVTLMEIVPVVKAALDAGAKELLLGILSPGGYVNAGNDIYDYFDSLKKQGIKINTTTIPDPLTGRGLVGSIATKLYLLGEDRAIDPTKDDFFIHNPWMNPGPSDSKGLYDSAETALKEEEALKAFYCAKTNNTPEALKPFMDAETSLTGQQAKDFGFATSFKTNSIKSNLLAKVKMKTGQKTLSELFASALDAITGKKPVKAQLKNKAGAVMADIAVTDANGVGYCIDSDTITDLSQVMSSPTPVPIFLANPDGTPSANPAPDGDITTTDGYVISVSGGNVSNVKQSTDMENKELTAKIAALEKDNTEIKAGLAQVLEAFKSSQTSNGLVSAELMNKTVNDAVMALRKDIGSTHIPARTAKDRNAQVKAQLQKMSPIQLKMKYPNGIPADVKKILEEGEVEK